MTEELVEINSRIKNLLTSSTLLVCEVLFTGALLLTWVFTDFLNEQYAFLTIFLLIVFTVNLTAKRSNFFNYAHHPIIFLSVYHVVLASFLIFVIPILSPFAYIWILLLFVTDYYRENTGLVISYFVLLITSELSIIVNNEVLTNDELILLIGQNAIIFGLGLVLAKSHQATNHERAALKKSTDIARFEHQRLISLINNLGNAVVSVDEDGIVRLYNAAALDLLNTNISLEGHKLHDFLHLVDDDDKDVDLVSLAHNDNKQVLRSDLRHKFSEDDMVNLYINMSPIYLGFNQEGKGYIIILRDITKEKTLEQEKDEFISVVSHELRTPITIAEGNISNAILVNSKGRKDKEMGEAMELAHKQVIFLADMINDLSTLSRAERNVLSLNLGEIDANALAESVRKEYEPQAEEKGLKLKLKIEKNLPKILNSQLYIEEIIQNFITNSIKYTKKGHIMLTVTSDDDNTITFSVSDTGIGISKSDQKKVFDKFFRSEDYRTRESSGTGLGLYVTAKLVKKIGAQIEIDSTLNKGSTFSLTVRSITEAADADKSTQ